MGVSEHTSQNIMAIAHKQECYDLQILVDNYPSISVLLLEVCDELDPVTSDMAQQCHEWMQQCVEWLLLKSVTYTVTLAMFVLNLRHYAEHACHMCIGFIEYMFAWYCAILMWLHTHAWCGWLWLKSQATHLRCCGLVIMSRSTGIFWVVGGDCPAQHSTAQPLSCEWNMLSMTFHEAPCSQDYLLRVHS
jgi:hypothetical protein